MRHLFIRRSGDLGRRGGGLAGLALLAWAAPLSAGPATGPAAPPGAAPATQHTVPQADDRAAMLRERGRLLEDTGRLRAQGDLAGATAAAGKMLALERRLFGDAGPDVASTLEMLGAMRRDAGDWEAARAAREEAAAIREKLTGPGNGPGGWRAGDDRREARDLDLRRGLSPDQQRRLAEAEEAHVQAVQLYLKGDYRAGVEKERQTVRARQELLGPEHPATAVALGNLAALDEAAGDYAAAEPLLRRALAVYEKALGLDHPDTAGAMGNLADLYRANGDYAAAEPLLRRALEVDEKALGPMNPGTAAALNNLAVVCQDRSDYAGAAPLLQRSLAIREATLGPEHAGTATALNNLAGLYQTTADYAKAEPLLRRALAIREKAQGPGHPDTATALNNLAELYRSTGDYALAMPLLRRALEIREKVLGPEHPDTAATLSNLAGLYQTAGDFAAAEPLLRRALAVCERRLGPEHPDTATALNNLAELYQNTGDYAGAEPLLQRSLRIREKALGPQHPETATALNNLALLYQTSGDYARAEALLRRVLDIREKVLGPEHADTAVALNNLGTLRICAGDAAGAQAPLRRAVDATARLAALTAPVQSERQQLASAAQLRYALDAYLSAARPPGTAGEAARGEAGAAEAYERVLRWKGAVSARQRAMRAARRAASKDPEAAKQFDDLERAARRLANLASVTPPPERAAEYRRRVVELSRQVERLQADLAGRGGASLAAEVTAEQMCKALPAGVALVDVLEYDRATAPPGHKGSMGFEPRLAAFVLRRERPVAWVDLGPSGPVEAAVAAWRRTLGRVEGTEAAGAELRRRVWEPVAERVAGASVVLVSPDGPLCRFPVGALPGREPGTYLIEDVAVATVAVPSLLPGLMERLAGAGDSEAASLLVVGDVDYDAEPGVGQARPIAAEAAPVESHSAARGAAGRWARLDATGEEADEVRAAFARGFPGARADALTLAGATESAARAAMPAHRFLHLATHGFFADPSRRSALARTAAGAGTGAGAGAATQPATQSAAPDRGDADRRAVSGFHPGLLSGLVLAGANHPAAAGSGGDDGILTALEVEELDLSRVRLAVLSACETGLGPSAGGEGLLGLQRAFQAAGTETVVASLWQVPDRETQQLMTLFYRNLWEKKMTRLEALRQAQIAMLRGGPGGEGAGRGRGRGAEFVEDATRPADAGRLAPYAWAAFVLSGDWR